MKSFSTHPLYRAIVQPNPKATKVLFYLTSYAFPWWVYIIPIIRFRRMGYEVVVYDLHDAILENIDPNILPSTTTKLIEDMASRQSQYEANGIKIFHGIGNSLGSYLIFNYALRYQLQALVLNGGGSIADVIFHAKNGSWKKIASAYAEIGFDHKKLHALWAEFDLPTLGKNIKASRVLLAYSLKDGTIPLESTEGIRDGLYASGKEIYAKTDNLPHILSVVSNSFRVKSLYKFLNG